MEDCRVDFKKIPWENPAPGARFKAFRNNDQQLRLVEFSKEFEEPDWCTRGHVGYVLEGHMEIDFSGKWVTFKAGDGVFIPAGDTHKHKAKVVSERVRLILVEDS